MLSAERLLLSKCRPLTSFPEATHLSSSSFVWGMWWWAPQHSPICVSLASRGWHMRIAILQQGDRHHRDVEIRPYPPSPLRKHGLI